MEFHKLSKKVLVFGLAAAMTVTSVSVTPANTASAKTKQTKVSIAAGKTKKLTVKKPKKKVKWSTSNKKVVKIGKTTGKKKNTVTIKAVKKGSAVITAKVGKKKTQWKVTVTKKTASTKKTAAVTNISSVKVDPLDSTCIELTLKKAAAVNVSDLTISSKRYNEGTYNDEITVKTLTATPDQKAYRIYTNSYIGYGSYLKLAIGKDTAQIQYTRDIVGTSGANVTLKKESRELSYCSDFFSNTIGTVKYSIKEGALPTGMEINAKRGIIKGIPTVTGTFPVTIEATDELKRTATATVTYIIYDKTTIVCPEITTSVRLDDYTEERVKDAANAAAAATTSPTGTTASKEKTYAQSITIAPQGGSGLYNFKLGTTDVTGATISTDIVDANGTVTGCQTAATTKLNIPYNVTAGNHAFTITVTDALDPNLTTTAVVNANAVQYFNVSGTAMDSNAGNLSGNYVYFYPADATSSSSYIRSRSFVKKSTTNSDYDYGYDKYESGYYIYNHEYSARVGSSDDSTAEMGAKKGTYKSEIPAGEYIVKIYSSADDIYYQMPEHVTVASDQMTALQAPVRFYSVMGIATYQNTKPIKNQYVYFEIKDEKYESNLSLEVKTDATGSFVASLPANTYSAYIYDEKGDRRYFTTDVAVTGAQDVTTLTGFSVDISRYELSGVAYKTVQASSTNTTASADAAANTTRKLMTYTKLYFYAPDGDVTEVRTDKDGAFSVSLPGAAAPGITYTVKAEIDSDDEFLQSLVCAAGSVTVVDGQDSVSGIELTYKFDQNAAAGLLANATVDAGAATATITKDNRIMDNFVAFAVTDAGKYNIEFANSVPSQTLNRMKVVIFDSKGTIQVSRTESNASAVTCKKVYLSEAGTYYAMLLPENKVTTYDDDDDDDNYTTSYVKQPGTYTVTVTRGSGVITAVPVDTETQLTLNGSDVSWFKFTPSEDGDYTFNVSSDGSFSKYLYYYGTDAEGDDYDWLNSTSGYTANMTRYGLDKDKTYYFGVKFGYSDEDNSDSSSVRTVKVKISKKTYSYDED